MTHTNPSISEAEATLQDLVNQLEAADDLEEQLAFSSTVIAYEALTKGGAAKTRLEKLEKEIFAAQTRQKMLAAAIIQAEAILSKARADAANADARQQANEAREIIADLQTLGADMDAAFDILLAAYKRIQDSAVRMDALGYGFGFPRNGLNDAILIHVAGTLQMAGFDIQGFYGTLAHVVKPFGTIMAEQEISTHRKTESVLFPRVEKIEAPLPPVNVPATQNVWDVRNGVPSGLRSFGDLGLPGPPLWSEAV
jgi:hypothetical protein